MDEHELLEEEHRERREQRSDGSVTEGNRADDHASSSGRANQTQAAPPPSDCFATTGPRAQQLSSAPATRLVVALMRFQALIVTIVMTRAASAGSLSCRAASCQISSGTGSARPLSRVMASVSARAARSASVKSGASRQAATAKRR